MSNPNNPFGIPNEMFDAIVAKEIYDSYVNAGFNEVQAFELLKTVLTTKRTLF